MRTFEPQLFPRISLGVIALTLGGNWAGYSVSASEESKPSKRIAVIGGGISGSFVTKYLSDYDADCSLDITVFDPPPSKNNQGSRVSSHALADGTVVELGASIVFGGNKLVNEMIEGSVGIVDEDGNDEELRKTKPHSDGVDSDDPEIRNGLGIFNGKTSTNTSSFPLLLSNMADDEKTRTMLWRYNLDLWRIDRATKAALESFDAIYGHLDNIEDESSFFESANDIWEAVGLSKAASLSFEEYLDSIGVGSSVAWWRKLLDTYSEQGLVQKELYEPINICNNNQINSQMTGLAGLVNSAAATGDLYAVEGGNDRLISSAFRQAIRNREEKCPEKSNLESSQIKKRPIQIETLVSLDSQQKIELFDSDGKLVDPKPYDIVIVATPLQFSGIQFMGKGSLFDEALLYNLPLNEMVDSENSDANKHEHLHSLGGEHHLPSSARRPYTQVITTFIANGVLQPSYFQVEDGNILPRSILFTEAGQNLTGLSSIGQITRDVYKVFSSTELSIELVKTIFGENARIEHTKVWGGSRGGATPSFNGAGEASKSTEFLLYNGGRQQDDDRGPSAKSSAIYYTNGMESAVSAIEIAAIGSKSVSKLVARQLGLVHPKRSKTNGEEL